MRTPRQSILLLPLLLGGCARSASRLIYCDEKSPSSCLGVSTTEESGKSCFEAYPEVSNRVTKVTAEQLGLEVSEIKPCSHFVTELGTDSLDTVELVMALEEEFDIEIPDTDAEKIKTVGEVVLYIAERSQARLPPPPD